MGEGDGERWKDSVDRQLDDHDQKIDNLRLWRAAVVAIGSFIGVVVGAFAKQILDLFKGLGS